MSSSYVTSLVCLLAAAGSFVRFFGLAYEVGDSKFLPPGACNQECQMYIAALDRSATLWMYVTLFLFGAFILFALLGRRG